MNILNTLRISFMAVVLAGLIFSPPVKAQVSLAQDYFERAVEFHFKGENEKSIKAFKQSLRYRSKDATTHFYLSLVYDVMQMGANAIKHMLKAEKYFEISGRDYWRGRSRERIEDYYQIYKYEKKDFEK